MVLKGNAKNETFLSNNKQYELSTAHGIILFVISVPSLFTNLAAILAAVWLLKLQPLSPNMFVLVLSCLDFAGVLCCGLPSWLVYITGKWRGGRLFCNFHGFVLLFFSLYSGSLAMCMAIDRCIAVRKPFYHRRVMTVQRSRNVMLFVTTLTFVFSMPPLFIEDGFILSLCGTFCTINWFSKDTARIVLCNVYAALGGFLLLGALLSNANVVFVLHKRKRQKISIIGLSSRLKSVAREKEVIEKQFSKMMVLLSIVFAFCWCPFMVCMIGNASFGWRNKNVEIHVFHMLLLNFVIDPVVYVLTRQQYRQVLRDVLCFISRRRVRHSIGPTTKRSSFSSSNMTTGFKASDLEIYSNNLETDSQDKKVDQENSTWYTRTEGRLKTVK